MEEKLKNLLEHAYAPYSKYRVSAIVVMKDNHEFYGVNVENASYGATICAERNAILNATGVQMDVTPMTAQRLIEKFKEKGLI